MERKQLYTKIQELNLQNVVKTTYGKNYTQVSNADLKTTINNTLNKIYAEEQNEWGRDASLDKAVTPNVAKAPSPTSVDNPFEAACLTFLGILKDTNLLEGLLTQL